MSKKIIDKIWQVGNSLRNNSHFIFNPKTMKKDQKEDKTQKIQQQPRSKKLKDKLETFKSNFQQLKSRVNNKINPLETMKQIKQKIHSKYQNRVKNITSKSIQKVPTSIKEHFLNLKQSPKRLIQIASKNLKDGYANLQQKGKEKTPDLNEYWKQIGSKFKNKKMKFQKFRQKNQEQLNTKAQQAQKILSSAKEFFSSNKSSQLNYIDIVMKKIFFRAALLMILGCFAYGIGSAIPRQIRHYLSRSKESNQQVKSDPVVQAIKLS